MPATGNSVQAPAAGNAVQVPAVQPNKDGSVTIQYVPIQSGVHELNLSYNEATVDGMPLRINVDATDKGQYVTAYGPGLTRGACGQRLQFYVNKGGSTKAIDVSIDGPGKADIISKDDRNGVITVVYQPLTPGEYNISLKSNKTHIYGSPFCAKISGEGHKKSHISICETSDYTLGGCDVDLANMVGYMKTPMSTLEQCSLKKLQNGKLGIASFQPHKKGTYTVDVTQDNAKFPGSPFQIQIGDSELCTPSKVKVTGNIKEATANKPNKIVINVTDAGFGTLSITFEGSHRVEMSAKNTNRGEYTLEYMPLEPGIYLLNIKYGEDHIAGSPFMVKVGGEPSGRVRETVTKQIQVAETVIPNQPYTLCLKLPGASPLDMEAKITSPSGVSELCEIRDKPDNLYEVRFTPTEKGMSIISLKQKGIHLSGSPFQFSVGKTPSGGSHKIEFCGAGAERGAIKTKNEFNVYTHEAGSGILAVAIEGPSKADIKLMDSGTGFVTVTYTVQRQGEYNIIVKFDDQHVPKSPCRIQIDPECEEARRITLHGIRDRGLEVEKPATFTINNNGANGTLKGYLITPSGLKEDIVIQELDNEGSSVRFMPKENGVYYVNIKFNDAHIPGSPFPMLIGKLGADPALVVAKGDGLESGKVGVPSKFIVDTGNAGCGSLGVLVEGPSKVAVVCSEVEEGYEFSFTATAPGVYMITIKFCNVGVAGSPFKSTLTGSGKPSENNEVSGIYVETTERKPGASKVKNFKGDASKVVVVGTALQKGHAGRMSVCTIDLKEAGQALLAVSMISPTGAPAKEMSCKKQKPAVYTVSYMAEEKGDHIFQIKYGNDDVPGSPFVINMA